MFPDLREELTRANQEVRHPVAIYRSPEIRTRVNGIPVDALVDTGSTVTAMSDTWYEANSETLKDCPTLPITGSFVVGVTGSRSERLKRQVFVEMRFGSVQFSAPTVVVPGMVQDFIIGVDTLRSLAITIDFGRGALCVPTEDGAEKVPLLTSRNEPVDEPDEEAVMVFEPATTAEPTPDPGDPGLRSRDSALSREGQRGRGLSQPSRLEGGGLTLA
ncbi:protein DDI1 homolog 2-like [Osmia bicornis bicornis]|uniref:protein DDI1 homolog 2-like n=1 Tax=Osmia bicornis bicornis TaxID=1437191 RepID=UPI001EAE8B66|nr:protein DDI1 homolog 2-like [Osmia bicornis bicornis]